MKQIEYTHEKRASIFQGFINACNFCTYNFHAVFIVLDTQKFLA